MRCVPALVLAVLVAGCLQGPVGPQGPPGPAGTGAAGLGGEAATGGTSGTSGGQVTNSPPAFQSFTGSLGSADNSGTISETFTGAVLDSNGERDMRLGILSVALTGAATGTFTHTISAAESGAPSEPASFGADGWKVWSSTPNDGVLNFKFRYTFPIGAAPGTDTFTVSITPSGGTAIGGPSDATTVGTFSEIQIPTTPVNADGSPAAVNNWGLWSAAPGATNVESSNFVKLTNTGQKLDASVVLDFTEAVFAGADENFSIPLNGNVQFAWTELAAGATSPSGGTYTYLAVSADGSATVTFSGLNKVIFVKYRLVQLPAVLAEQSYGASYTATEL